MRYKLSITLVFFLLQWGLFGQTKEQLLTKAQTQIDAKDFSNAINSINQCLDLDGQLAVAYFHRGYCYLMLNKPNIALVDFNQAILLDANLIEAYFNRGLAHQALKNYTFKIL